MKWDNTLDVLSGVQEYIFKIMTYEQMQNLIQHQCKTSNKGTSLTRYTQTVQLMICYGCANSVYEVLSLVLNHVW